ncbi:flagellar transcriptional regulator FlhD [Herbaspirillum sp. AP02]|uniref:flagellar transcriptional regulator FlhD n=1 Tax=unclassified Herbaspirillum TaxID=2624150 RepID=UPI0015DA7C89|nr:MULTISPECIES: flagellar transcriptional regulator FlhD [unclassified Herbaspirillum]MBG7620659.1 flagellar transcriptional regulator FlhD [Herbaspirillum sp. AP02]NZD68123.1 flagellar transcriptional regulator FlhD [Herbaspirillum sp. AP21]
MNTNDMMTEIRDANLSYLMLAQQMVRQDKPTAIFRLGISAEIADLIEGLSNAQIMKLAATNMMLTRFRFDDGAILGMLTNYNKDKSLAQSHAAILMACQPSEQIS